MTYEEAGAVVARVKIVLKRRGGDCFAVFREMHELEETEIEAA